MDLAERERLKYVKVWKEPSYREGCHSIGVWDDYCAGYGSGYTVIDLGCGTGRLVDRLNREGYLAFGVDIAPNSVDPGILATLGNRFEFQPLWERLPVRDGRADIGVCADVMEHIPEERVDDTFWCIMAACQEVYFLIEGTLDYAGRMGREPLHLTVKPKAWWVNRIRGLGFRTEDLPEGAHYRATAHYLRVSHA